MKKLYIGVTGFEPMTSCSQSRRSTRLSYTPWCVVEGERMIAHRRGEVKPKHLRAFGAQNFYFVNHQSQIINHKSSLPRFSVDRGGGFRYNVMIIGGRSE